MLYDSFASDLASGNIAPSRDTFKVLLVKDYVFNASHAKVADVASGEVAASGYTKGGKVSAVTVKKVGSVTTLEFSDVRWDISDSMAATGSVVYTDAGLVMYLDFGKVVSCTDSTFTCHFARGLGISSGGI